MRYMREKATGEVHALGRNEAQLFDGAPDGYEEVVVLPADTSRHILELPEVSESRPPGTSVTHWVDGEGLRVSLHGDNDLDGYERRTLVRLAAVRAERERRLAEAEKAAPGESDAWAGVDRAEIIRQAEEAHRANERLREALDTVRARLSAREEELRIASNSAVAIESELAILRRNLGKARS